MVTLWGTWEEHYIKGTLPPEWQSWGDCRNWSIENNYLIEYGYIGEFSQQGCLKAMPGYKSEGEAAAERIAYLQENNTLAELKEIAANRGLDIEKSRTKKEIAAIIADGV